MKTFAVSLLLASSVILFGLGFDTNYQQDIDLTITAIKTANNLDELNESPFNPHSTFQKILRSPISEESLCGVLHKLSAKDLSLLEPILIEFKAELQISCMDQLLRKISKYHSQQNTVFFNLAEKNKQFLEEGGTSDEMLWSPLNPIIPIGEKQPYFFKGTSLVTRGSVIYQRDITNGSTEVNKLQLKKGEIVLTFDDGPHPSRTKQVLDILNRHQVHALFFAMGSKAKQYPEIIKEVINQNNIYGSHSNTHQNLPKISEENAKDEVRQGHLNVVHAANGEDSGFFRFPYGARTTYLAQFLKNNSMSSFFWNMDTLDWKYTEPVTLYNHIVSEINRERKGVLLFHDVHQQTVTVLNTVLENLYNAGYSIRVAVPIEWAEAQND